MSEIKVVKRDGSIVDFDFKKIKRALGLAEKAVGVELSCEFYLKLVGIFANIEEIYKDKITVEEIQDIVINSLISFSDTLGNTDAKKIIERYILYREARRVARENESELVKTYNEIVETEDNDFKNDNANINANIPAGQAMKVFSANSKQYALDYLIKPKFSKMHKSGEFHIHDLDYYMTKTTNCLHSDLVKLFKNGIKAIEGDARPPKRLDACASLAPVAGQSSQNEQFGGQSFPNYDYAFALGIRKAFVEELEEILDDSDIVFINKEVILSKLKKYVENNSIICETGYKYLEELFNIYCYEGSIDIDKTIMFIENRIKRRCKQASEAFIHNCVMMHSRGGGQVAFLSVNVGTDTTTEGRLATESLLNAVYAGIGKDGDTAIFPIVIFKVKDGINYSDEDYKLFNEYSTSLEPLEEPEYKTPNFDLFLLALKVQAKRHFPTFLFLDSTFNKSPLWREDDPERWKYEIATMGCRTRVFEDLHGISTSIGRGNASFTTINLPRLAIKANKNVNKFFESLESIMNDVAEQLYDRLMFQRKAFTRQFPFIVGNDLFNYSEEIVDNKLDKLLKHFTLGVGFIGLSETLVSLIGKHHGESEEAQKLGLKIVSFMREKCDRFKEEYNLNYGLFASPAEGTCLSLLNKDVKEFGIIPGVTDKKYYSNSHHVPVFYNIKADDKIKIEAPYHELCNAGTISYIEVDDAKGNNILAAAKIIKTMKDNNMGYVAINHPDNRCLDCGYNKTAFKNGTCPQCGSKNIKEIARITGYLTGDISRWNSGKKAELRDRVKHC